MYNRNGVMVNGQALPTICTYYDVGSVQRSARWWCNRRRRSCGQHTVTAKTRAVVISQTLDVDAPLSSSAACSS